MPFMAGDENLSEEIDYSPLKVSQHDLFQLLVLDHVFNRTVKIFNNTVLFLTG
jgi:hypothetical protein